MARLNLTVACDLNDRSQALFTGDVGVDGVDLNMLPVEIEEVAKRMAWFGEFDVSEMSMSNYILARSKEEDSGMIAIPVFPSRMFRHSCVWVNTDAGIEEPADLTGKTVGTPAYPMTAGLWMRGILHDEYGVDARDIDWFYGGQEDSGREVTVPFSVSDEMHVEPINEGETLSEMLANGDLDALLTARTPSSATLDSVERLFPDFREVEREYFQRTGMFPIMHTIVIRTDVYEENPWVARELTEAFTEAKDMALRNLLNTAELKVALPWVHSEVEATLEQLGNDYWPYGVEANRGELERMTQYSYDQGLSHRKVDVDELFAPPVYRDPTKV